MSGHSHNHTGCDGDDKHDETPEMGIEYSLFKKIDSENLECLNEKIQHSGKEVFRAWEERLSTDKFVESDVDEELLFNIPFTGNIKLKGVIIIGGEGETHPSKMRLFKNRPNMSFDDVAIESDQDFELHPDTTGTLEYSTKQSNLDNLMVEELKDCLKFKIYRLKEFVCRHVDCNYSQKGCNFRIVKFSSVHHLSIHIPKNFGSETTKIYYIGLRGEFSEGHHHGVTICTYEARPNVADHKTNLTESISREIQ